MMTYRGKCVCFNYLEICELRHSSEDVPPEELRGAVEGLDEWAELHGYDKDLKLEDDWHVGYHKGTINGQPCYFLTWSGYECIWM